MNDRVAKAVREAFGEHAVLMNLPQAWALHLAEIPASWPDEKVEAERETWLQGVIDACRVLETHAELRVIDACRVLETHAELQTLSASDLRKIADAMLDAP